MKVSHTVSHPVNTISHYTFDKNFVDFIWNTTFNIFNLINDKLHITVKNSVCNIS
jgi:hypothetical protein